MTGLKPCPFCGGAASYQIDDHWDDKHVITCEYCGCERRSEYGYEAVKDEWNTRATGLISVDKKIPTERCIAFTPNQSLDMTYRIIPANLFKQVASSATHWAPLPEAPSND